MQDAVQAVTQAAASAGVSGHSKLDKSLKKLLLSVGAASSNDRSDAPMGVASCKYWTGLLSMLPDIAQQQWHWGPHTLCHISLCITTRCKDHDVPI